MHTENKGLLNEGIDRFSSLPYLINAETKQELTFYEENKHSSYFAYQLNYKYHIKEKDKVIIMMENSAVSVIAFHALLKLKAIPIPLSPDLTMNELKSYESYLSPAAIVGGPAVEEKILKSDCIQILLSEDWDSAESEDVESEYFYFPEYSDEELGAVIFTSGTTSKPKGAMLKLNHLLVTLKKCSKQLRMQKDTRMFQVMPFYHAEGCLSTIFVPFLTGSSVLYLNRLDIEKIMNYWNYVNEFKADYLILLPTLIQTLNTISRNKKVISSAKYAKCGSSFLAPEVRADFEDTFGVKIIDIYGSTEANAISIGEFTDSEYDYSVGRITHITDVKLSEEGEILVANAEWFAGYMNNEELTRKVFDGHWYRTGDVGYIKNDKLYLIGRIDDLINRNGYKISPQSIDEEMIKIHKYIAQCFTVGVRDKNLNDEIVTFIVLKDKQVQRMEDIRDNIFFECRKLLSVQKIPDRLIFVDEIINNAVGKPSKQLMLEKYC